MVTFDTVSFKMYHWTFHLWCFDVCICAGTCTWCNQRIPMWVNECHTHTFSVNFQVCFFNWIGGGGEILDSVFTFPDIVAKVDHCKTQHGFKSFWLQFVVVKGTSLKTYELHSLPNLWDSASSHPSPSLPIHELLWPWHNSSMLL